MKALIYRAPWTVDLGEIDEPAPAARDDVVVELRAIGICGTDLGIVSGSYPPVRPPVVLGHEAAGVVHAVGAGITDLAPGDRVVLDPTYSCQYCRMCVSGRSNHCLHKDGTECGVSADGMFSRLHLTQRRFLHRFPDSVPFTAAALTEPLSCAVTGVKQLVLRTDHTAVVVGGGPMGVLYSHALAVRGVLGAVVEVSAARREVMSAALPDGWSAAADLDAAMRTVGAGDIGFDIVVETSGRAVDAAMARLARGGQLLAVGLGGPAISVDPAVFADHSKRLVGSIDSLDGSFAAALDLIVSGRIPAEKIVSHVFSLSDYAKAFGLLGIDLDNGLRTAPEGALKIVLTP
ncbi:threonine dehydrogenase-like Zn-dependent dehydrogenase [Nocardia tenerifensis]|uniref:Threonine dehydrogenase-like Zn-dependent dehydrogenase n=1 Tax=Nocardia tenerifensis TaxID=228006 RepID=A0A318KGV2_9NOCA|nr:alcohol dehydrogenase catalytic domain-containing protein [Nocardia tenerifensis]PXX59330.1 threonine dehydrogenase-like Zn-dependent dehydrogenase [Nocardia tenerifensis]